MVPTVASLGRKCAHAFIKHGVVERLCQLLLADHMATSLKLMALRALDSLADYPQGMEQLLGWSGTVSSLYEYRILCVCVYVCLCVGVGGWVCMCVWVCVQMDVCV